MVTAVTAAPAGAERPPPLRRSGLGFRRWLQARVGPSSARVRARARTAAGSVQAWTGWRVSALCASVACWAVAQTAPLDPASRPAFIFIDGGR